MNIEIFRSIFVKRKHNFIKIKQYFIVTEDDPEEAKGKHQLRCLREDGVVCILFIINSITGFPLIYERYLK